MDEALRLPVVARLVVELLAGDAPERALREATRVRGDGYLSESSIALAATKRTGTIASGPITNMAAMPSVRWISDVREA